MISCIKSFKKTLPENMYKRYYTKHTTKLTVFVYITCIYIMYLHFLRNTKEKNKPTVCTVSPCHKVIGFSAPPFFENLQKCNSLKSLVFLRKKKCDPGTSLRSVPGSTSLGARPTRPAFLVIFVETVKILKLNKEIFSCSERVELRTFETVRRFEINNYMVFYRRPRFYLFGNYQKVITGGK